MKRPRPLVALLRVQAAGEAAGASPAVLDWLLAAADAPPLPDAVAEVEADFLLDNDPRAIPALVALLRRLLTAMALCDDRDCLRAAIALEEAIHNAVCHGNLEVSSELRNGDGSAYRELIDRRRREVPFCERRVHVRARVSHGEAVWVVRDEGPGFDPAALPDPTVPPQLEQPSGRGLLLIRSFMDEVRHNPAGNEITMVKRRTRTLAA